MQSISLVQVMKQLLSKEINIHVWTGICSDNLFFTNFFLDTAGKDNTKNLQK